ncbi:MULTISPECIES: serine/threonine-protein kinase [unclassified Streptomyces]|uniref:serine/threonine-protein kinase n=2 Tax=unclassified Streptomyces TaxID=2593676 RepID=UPI0001C1B5E2|nr:MULTISPECIES: serine/threonine-protein kinase [unclassified Streptomyces]MYR69435.1 protein kinase [Streptomyces sp. SID4939]MYT66351.1 protein kinase [Streptomyces sp. SID8357]MYT83271.1 protein kinase [Streptomyces sp. SID8360]MYW35996.1 protein kinase [Streptomyces sp. SID1]AEN08504.1 serine/threonine protein kinase [Streptomyces sp. SirexAA-E]
MDELRPQDPSHIGAYALLARLGAGGMGLVFLGRSPGGRLVAVKVIRAEISDHPEALARFRREVATVRTVRGNCTAQLVDASLDTPPYWLATEYVAGPTLRQAVEAAGPLPPGSAVRLLAALAEGLVAVHAHGVTHRDLKPQNVILAPQGPQLIDFGIARGLDQTVLTREGMASGTPGFAAPEVVRFNEAGPAADVFALGATLAYTATGRPPYGTGDPAVVSYRAVHEDIDLAGVEPSLAALIRDCVAKDPAHRPDPATVIARCAVDSALAMDPHYRALALERADRPVPAGGLAATALLPGHPATGRAPAPSEDAPAPPEDASVPPGSDLGPTPYDRAGRARRRGLRAALACAVAGAVAVTAWQLSEPDGGDTGGGGSGAASPTGGTAVSPKPTGGASAGPPDHIVDDRVSQDRWTLSEDPAEAAQGMGSCDLSRLSVATGLPGNLQSSVGHTTGSDTATVTLRPGKAAKGERAPYYVAVGVRPPHGTDRATGRPTEAVSEGIGFTSKPVDIFSGGSPDGTLSFRYPDDFRGHFADRTVEALPVGDDRGDWTVVLYHVEGGPTEYTSVACNGFHA